MGSTPQGEEDAVRTAEVIAAACLATDLGMGFPFEHGLHATLMTMRLAEILDIGEEMASQTYYASLLMYSGCTTDSDLALEIFAGSRTEHLTPAMFGSRMQGLGGVMRAVRDPEDAALRPFDTAGRLVRAARFRQPHFAAICEVAEMLANRLGVPDSVSGLFPYLTERWDGKGVLGRAKAEELPLPIRIIHVARDAAYQQMVRGDDDVAETVRSRAGHAFDPAIAEALATAWPEILAAARVGGSVWDVVLDVEPNPRYVLEGSGIDRALAAIGYFGDLVSPYQSGHASGVADLAAAAAEVCRLGGAEKSRVRRAAFVHDVGRVAVHPRVWQTTARLTADDWEQIRLHPYHTGRVFSRSPLLSFVADIGCGHHERLDGSGYHRGLSGPALPLPIALLAAADAYHAMTEPRPHRLAMTGEEAAVMLGQEAKDGRFHPDVVAAVLEAAGQSVPPLPRPAGLTDREAQVIGLVARGLQTKQVARRLDISPKTADRHIQNAYRKIGVSTRAAATVFAMEHGLVSGENSQ